MDVWLIQPGELLPIDDQSPRLYRTGLFAKSLADRGHKVTWWAGTFSHSQKLQRFPANKIIEWTPNIRLVLLHSPGYTQNISVQRFWDHIVLARNFRELISEESQPDIIHCGFPTIELAYEATKYGAVRNVPVVLDTRDMWPDIFVNAFPSILRPASKLFFKRKFVQTRQAFESAFAISGHAPGFVDFGLRYANRPARVWDRSFPFAYPEQAPDATAQKQAFEFWQQYGITPQDTIKTVCFFGAFGSQKSLDFETPIKAFIELQKRSVPVRLVLCGAGPQLEKLRALSAGNANIIIPGWVNAPQIWTLMRMSIAGLLPYLPADDFRVSIPNKAIEYLSASLPIISSLTEGYLHDILTSSSCGIFYESGNPQVLADTLQNYLLSNNNVVRQSHENAGKLYQENYVAEKVYNEMCVYLEDMVRANAQ